jgi:hypothetical protein
MVLIDKMKLSEIEKGGLKIPLSLRECRFDSDLRHHFS